MFQKGNWGTPVRTRVRGRPQQKTQNDAAMRFRLRSKRSVVPIGTAGWIEAWLARHRGRSVRTAQEYARAVMDRAQGVVALIEAGYADRIGPAEAERVAAALRRRYGPSTVAVTLSALSSLWRELIREGVAQQNPWREIGRETPRATYAERILTEAEVAAVIAAAPPGVPRTLVRTAYALGARASELAGLREDGRPGLRWRDVGEDRITLFGKGSKTRIVYCGPELVRELRRLPGPHGPDDPVFRTVTGYPMRRQHIQRIVAAAAKAAGVRTPGRPVSPHWLRHSHVTHALRAGAPIHVVQQTVGHASMETTGRYAHLVEGESSVGYVAGLGGTRKGGRAPSMSPPASGPARYHVRGGRLRPAR